MSRLQTLLANYGIQVPSPGDAVSSPRVWSAEPATTSTFYRTTAKKLGDGLLPSKPVGVPVEIKVNIAHDFDIDNEIPIEVQNDFNYDCSTYKGPLNVVFESVGDRSVPAYLTLPEDVRRKQAISDKTRLPRPAMSKEASNSYPAIAGIYKQVCEVGKPNYRGARVPIPTNINIKLLRELLVDYPGRVIVDFLEFGCPAGYQGSVPPERGPSDYKSARDHAGAVDKFVEKEVSYGAIKGPFKDPPFEPWCPGNAIMTCPKSESEERRVILDFKRPLGASVNSCIPIDSVDDIPICMKLIALLEFRARLAQLGAGAHMSKTDMRRAYRQLPSDPLDYALLALKWKDVWYWDGATAFGLRWGGAFCQMLSEAIAYICLTRDRAIVHPYVDDTSNAEKDKSTAWVSHKALTNTIKDLGLEIAPDKCVEPTQLMIFLGILFNTILMIMSVNPVKVKEAWEMCKRYISTDTITRNELQKLLGRLFHVSSCAQGSRRFLNRLLDLLKESNQVSRVTISLEAKLDLAWFVNFIPAFNGQSVIRDDTIDFEVAVDSCLTGGGGVAPEASYRTTYNDGITSCNFSISSLECYNLLLATRLWVSQWQGKHVAVFCDNAATVSVLTAGRGQDPLMRACAREMWYLAATHDCNISIFHRPGAENCDPDTLSRAHLSERFAGKLKEFVARTGREPIEIPHCDQTPPMLI